MNTPTPKEDYANARSFRTLVNALKNPSLVGRGFRFDLLAKHDWTVCPKCNERTLETIRVPKMSTCQHSLCDYYASMKDN